MTWDKKLHEEIAKRHAVGEDFTIEELYDLEEKFKRWYPNNQHILETLRDVIQNLRDKGFVKFVDNEGRYQRIA